MRLTGKREAEPKYGMTCAEIARMTGWSPVTVQSYWRRGMAKLRKHPLVLDALVASIPRVPGPACGSVECLANWRALNALDDD